jgi:hypothetical protein
MIFLFWTHSLSQTTSRYIKIKKKNRTKQISDACCSTEDEGAAGPTSSRNSLRRLPFLFLCLSFSIGLVFLLRRRNSRPGLHPQQGLPHLFYTLDNQRRTRQLSLVEQLLASNDLLLSPALFHQLLQIPTHLRHNPFQARELRTRHRSGTRTGTRTSDRLVKKRTLLLRRPTNETSTDRSTGQRSMVRTLLSAHVPPGSLRNDDRDTVDVPMSAPVTRR